MTSGLNKLYCTGACTCCPGGCKLCLAAIMFSNTCCVLVVKQPSPQGEGTTESCFNQRIIQPPLLHCQCPEHQLRFGIIKALHSVSQTTRTLVMVGIGHLRQTAEWSSSKPATDPCHPRARKLASYSWNLPHRPSNVEFSFHGFGGSAVWT